MNKKTRLIFLGLSVLLLVILGYILDGSLNFLTNDFWFTSGLLLLILLSLIDQPFFSKDSNILINAITAGISLLIVNESERDLLFWIFFGFTVYLIVGSWILLWLRSKTLNREHAIIQFLSRINRVIGRPEAIFSAFFLWGAVKQYGYDSNEFNALLIYWVCFIIINIPEVSKIIGKLFEPKKESNNLLVLGKIFGVQSKNTFLIKLQEERPSVKIFDFVEFTYSVDSKSRIRKGLILDTYLLNEEQWIKVLATSEIDKIFGNKPVFDSHINDLVYKINIDPETDYLERFIGIITEKSTIGKIRFIYNSKAKINEGQLLEVKIADNIVLYQVVEGITKIEHLENKNQSGIIIGEAIQLGTWNSKRVRFEQFGWVPNINSPIYVASKIEEINPDEGEFLIGNIPDTNYPVIINKELSITHHTAILGVTGCGKSVFTRNLIKQIVNDTTKVIIIDLTGEYKQVITDIDLIINDENSKKAFDSIEILAKEKAKFQNNWDHKLIEEQEKVIKASFYSSIKDFLQNDKTESLFELPDISNNSNILDYTKWFFWVLFKTAKVDKCFGKRVCVVLEEAHTIVPELNSMGVSDFASKATVNSIAQIALQGRKYNIGFYVIAQRTANVSKTVLTQCNSIIAFQEFDKTSNDFLSNYLGKEFVDILPNLKPRQAIAVGKAFKSNVPMIFEVPEINEN